MGALSCELTACMFSKNIKVDWEFATLQSSILLLSLSGGGGYSMMHISLGLLLFSIIIIEEGGCMTCRLPSMATPHLFEEESSRLYRSLLWALQLNKCGSTRFWLDQWVSDDILIIKFPNLFILAFDLSVTTNG